MADFPFDFEKIFRESVGRRFHVVLRGHVVLGLALGAILVPIAHGDPTGWRFTFLLGAVSAFVVQRVWALSTLDVNDAVLSRIGAPFGALVVALAIGTGGVMSPIFPVLPIISFIVALILGPTRVLGALAVAIQVLIWAGPLHRLIPMLPDLAAPLGSTESTVSTVYLIATATIGSWICAVAAFGGTRMRALISKRVQRESAARRSEIEARSEHAGELTVLAAEVAHELKNPLASIKLLSSLIARDVDGKSAERLSVLREEVDRLETVLDEFLNFSRPLVPLSIVAADAGSLCVDVVRLHEGLAGARSIPLSVANEGQVPVLCDPRKLRQVLINLVQNAIDASADGSAVELAARADALNVVIEVRDRGPGVDPALLQRVWEPGVTSKENGSGLGLTVARALCVQHGGTLDLLPRDGGGTRAMVVLPRGGPA